MVLHDADNNKDELGEGFLAPGEPDKVKRDSTTSSISEDAADNDLHTELHAESLVGDSAHPPLPVSTMANVAIAPFHVQQEPHVVSPPAFEHPISVRKRYYMISIFTFMATLLFADQNLLAPNLTDAADDFGFDDDQKDTYLGGYIMAAFFIVGAPSAIGIGWLCDKVNRRNLLFAVVILGEAPCILTYWVTAYWQFFLLRVLTGISVGGCFPLVYSLLGDLFPTTQRSAVSAFVQIATGAGIFIGQFIAAIIGADNWRLPFVVVAAPAIVAALVMLFTTEEPPRGAFEAALQEAYAEGDQYKETITWAKVRKLLKTPSNWFIILQGLPGSLPWGMVQTYFNDFLSQQKGFDKKVATTIVTLFGIGGAIGVIGGGYLGQWLYNRKKEWMAWLMAGTAWAGMGPLYFLVNAPLDRVSIGFTVIVAMVGGCLASVAGPNLRAVMLNVNEPETRGVAAALQTMTDDLGKGLGPVIVAGFIHQLGRQGAFNIAVGGWGPCGLLLGSLVFFMAKDEAAMQARLQARALTQQAAAAEAGDANGALQHEGPPLSSSMNGLRQDLGQVSKLPLLAQNDSHLTSGNPAPATDLENSDEDETSDHTDGSDSGMPAQARRHGSLYSAHVTSEMVKQPLLQGVQASSSEDAHGLYPGHDQPSHSLAMAGPELHDQQHPGLHSHYITHPLQPAHVTSSGSQDGTATASTANTVIPGAIPSRSSSPSGASAESSAHLPDPLIAANTSASQQQRAKNTDVHGLPVNAALNGHQSLLEPNSHGLEPHVAAGAGLAAGAGAIDAHSAHFGAPTS